MADWLKIKTEYVTSDIGLRPLAKKWGVSFSTLEKRGRREGWTEQRRQFRQEVETKATSGAVEQAVNNLDIVLDGTEQLARLAVEWMHKAKSTQDLRNLAAVLREVGAMLREFYNVPTPGEAEARRIAAERLDLDRARADVSGGDSDGIAVVIPDKAEAWAE